MAVETFQDFKEYRSLIEKLRHFEPEEKKAAAIALALMGEEEALDVLIRIANGGHYTPEIWAKKHWYSSRKKVSDEKWEYSLQDQLEAIDALGKTRNTKALEYLRGLSSHTITPYEDDFEMVNQWTNGTTIKKPATVGCRAEFSQAQAALKSRLSRDYRRKVDPYDGAEREATGQQIQKDIEKVILEDEHYLKIMSAVKNLETAIEEERIAKMPKTPIKTIGCFKHSGAKQDELYTCAEFEVGLKWGIHARPATKISRFCSQYRDSGGEAEEEKSVIFEKVEGPLEAFESGNPRVSGCSIMGLMTLETSKGSRLRIYAQGTDANAWKFLEHLAKEIQREDFDDMQLGDIPAYT